MRLVIFLAGTVIMHVVVPELGGIDHLPDSLQALLTFES
jgi:hypothetical protein